MSGAVNFSTAADKAGIKPLLGTKLLIAGEGYVTAIAKNLAGWGELCSLISQGCISTVTFDEFEYTGDFQLHGSRAMYEEEFKFKDGSRRRHEQRVWMPNIDAIVAEITGVGFKMAHHSDMTAIGYEYQYLFIFQK
jgi:DNA polymerase III alpha subunit